MAPEAHQHPHPNRQVAHQGRQQAQQLHMRHLPARLQPQPKRASDVDVLHERVEAVGVGRRDET